MDIMPKQGLPEAAVHVRLHAYPIISLPLFNHRPQSEQVGEGTPLPLFLSLDLR